MQIKKLFPTPEFDSKLQRKLASSPAHYNFTRNVLRTYQVHSGVKHIDWDNTVNGQIPSAMYFIFLDNDQISGSIGVNPHTWLRYGCQRAHLIVNGYNHPAHSINIDETAGNIYNAYRWFLNNMGLRNSNEDIQIDIDKYYKDKFVIPFDLSHRTDNGFMPQINERGTVHFHCEFKNSLQKPLTLLCLSSYDSHISIDKDKEVSMDYTI